MQCAYRQDPVIKDFIRIIYGSSLLPTFNNHADPFDIIKTFLEFHLNNVPETGDRLIDLALKSFIKYFRQQRMSRLNLWNQFSNSGPRTTNNAEGFHSGLRSTFLNRHPPLGEFLFTIQKISNSYDRRIRMLEEGMDFPKNRREIDVWVDGQIENEKNVLLTHFWNGIVQHNSLLDYTRRISHLIGLNDRAEIE